MSMNAVVNSQAGASKAGEIIRTTGERVETGFWTTLNDLLLHIPNILGFLVAVAAAWLIGWLLSKRLERQLDRRGKHDLGRLLGTTLVGIVVLIGSLFALTLLFPRIDATNILSLLGIGSIALGFAFKDILQNLAAGVILLIREPYKTGDEIIVGDGEYEGVVEEVETRATHIRTIDQRLVIIPNVAIFSDAITVNTACDYRMANYTLSVAYGGDPRQAMAVMLAAVKTAEGVRAEPPPAIAIDALNDYSIDLYIVYAAGPTQPEQIRTKGAVLLAIHDACRANGISLPFPTQVNLIQADQGVGEPPDKLDGLPDRGNA